MKLPLSPFLKTLPVYQPGRPIEEVARELKLPAGSIIKVASNENPFGPSPLALPVSVGRPDQDARCRQGRRRRAQRAAATGFAGNAGLPLMTGLFRTGLLTIGALGRAVLVRAPFTTLGGVEFSVGKFGEITPVALFDPPVQLAGTTVRRASMHNASWVEKKDVRYGDTVVVEKAGEIIPQVVSLVASGPF